MKTNNWQPIETAPKTGKTVLYYSPTIGLWVGNEPPGCCRGVWTKANVIGKWVGGFKGSQDETHWQHLPEPP